MWRLGAVDRAGRHDDPCASACAPPRCSALPFDVEDHDEVQWMGVLRSLERDADVPALAPRADRRRERGALPRHRPELPPLGQRRASPGSGGRWPTCRRARRCSPRSTNSTRRSAPTGWTATTRSPWTRRWTRCRCTLSVAEQRDLRRVVHRERLNAVAAGAALALRTPRRPLRRGPRPTTARCVRRGRGWSARSAPIEPGRVRRSPAPGRPAAGRRGRRPPRHELALERSGGAARARCRRSGWTRCRCRSSAPSSTAGPCGHPADGRAGADARRPVRPADAGARPRGPGAGALRPALVPSRLGGGPATAGW